MNLGFSWFIPPSSVNSELQGCPLVPQHAPTNYLPTVARSNKNRRTVAEPSGCKESR